MNPYAASLGDRDWLEALAETPGRIRALVDAIGPAGLSKSYAPGRWSGRQLLVHLAQVELAFGVRARMALTAERYVVQPFDQDLWMAREPIVEPGVAMAAYQGLRDVNLALFRTLTADERLRPLEHPERGRMTLEEIPAMLAGHELHHLKHFEAIRQGG
jgi:hypothetical protein